MLTAFLVVEFWLILGGSVWCWHAKRARRREVRMRRMVERLRDAA